MQFRVWGEGVADPAGGIVDPVPADAVLAALPVPPIDVRGDVVVAELTPAQADQLRGAGFKLSRVFEPSVPPAGAVPESHTSDWPLWLVALRAPFRRGLVEGVSGVRLREVVDERLVIVRGAPQDVAALRQREQVETVSPLTSRQVLQQGVSTGAGLRDVVVVVDDAEDLPRVVAELQAGHTLPTATWTDPSLDPPRRLLRAPVTPALCKRLARLPGVRRVERAPTDDGEDDLANCRLAEHGGVPWASGWQALLDDVGLSGDGVTVGLWDYGLVLPAPHLDHVVAGGHTSVDPGDHATGVVSMLAARDTVGAGMVGAAPDVGLHLYESAFDGSFVEDLGRAMRAAGVRLVNISRNGGDANDYTSLDAALDREVRWRGRQELVLVFSAGNKAFPKMLTKETKNGVLVGGSTVDRGADSAILDSDSVWAGSSEGPTFDGRRLPTVVAPAASVQVVGRGPASSGVVRVTSGTSYAAPVVTGLLALLAQQRAASELPPLSAAATRALLVASTRPLTGAAGATPVTVSGHPAWTSAAGWGAVDARALLRRPADGVPARVVWDQPVMFTREGQSWTRRVVPDDAARGVRVVLAWTDAAAAPGLSGADISAVVNRLRLDVRQGDRRWRDEALLPWPVVDGTGQPPRFYPDNLLVVDLGPIDGVLEAQVTALSLRADALHASNVIPRQDFALVITNAVMMEG